MCTTIVNFFARTVCCIYLYLNAVHFAGFVD